MDYNLWQQLILGATKPFRTGANILAQNWSSALTGKDMSQGENQGRFLKWLAGGLTSEEQEEITNKPYLSALKSGAGMASTLAPFASQSLRTAQFAANPLANRIAQLTSQGALEGGLGGFGQSREGKEVQDTLVGAGLGAGGELLMDYLTNPQFRKMITEASTYIDPTTGTRMYRGGLGNNDDIIINRWDDPKPIAKADGEIPMSSYEDYLDPDNPVINLDGSTVDNRRVKYTGPEIVDSADIDKMVDPDNPVIDILKDDPIARLEIEAKNYATPEEFIEATAGKSTYSSKSADITRGTLQKYNPLKDEVFAEPQIKDNKILVFRATTNKGLIPGDFIATHENTAKGFLRTSGDNAKVISEWVPIEDVYTTQNGYQVYKPGGKTLLDIWKQAHPNELGNSIRGGFREIIEKMGRDGLK